VNLKKDHTYTVIINLYLGGICIFYVCIFRNKTVSNKYFISVLVRLFLERREKQFNKFMFEFQQLTVSDEKVRSPSLTKLNVSISGAHFTMNNGGKIFIIDHFMAKKVCMDIVYGD
jgi:hypothetical protein